MNETNEIPDNPAARIRAVLGAWAARHPKTPVAEFENQITIDSIEDFTVHAAFLTVLVDSRSEPVDRQFPYQPDSLPPKCDRGNPWSAEVNLKKEFLDQEQTVLALDPGEPMSCNRCSGGTASEACKTCSGKKMVVCAACAQKGRKSCAHCHGEGKTACAMCSATGKVVASIDASGFPSLGVCPQCAGKKEFPCHDCQSAPLSDCAQCSNRRTVGCGECAGSGIDVCSHCKGAGQFINGYSLKIHYAVVYHRSLMRDPKIPEDVFPEDPPPGKLGETIFELQGSDGALDISRLEGAAAQCASKVLAQAPSGDPRSRLVLQSIKVEKIPLWLVTYGFEGKVHRAWVSSYENRVSALDDPFAKRAESMAAQAAERESARKRAQRDALRAGAIVTCAAATLIPLILEFVFRSPNRHGPLAILAVLILAGGSSAIWFLRGWRIASAAAATAAVVLISAAFGLAAPIHRLDVREFETKLSALAAAPFGNWGEDDGAVLAQLIKDFTARGVDTSTAETLRDEYASFAVAAREKAARDQQQARHEAAVAQRNAELARLDAERKTKVLAAKKAAAKKAAAKKAAVKKPAKKKPAKTRKVKRRA